MFLPIFRFIFPVLELWMRVMTMRTHSVTAMMKTWAVTGEIQGPQSSLDLAEVRPVKQCLIHSTKKY